MRLTKCLTGMVGLSMLVGCQSLVSDWVTGDDVGVGGMSGAAGGGTAGQGTAGQGTAGGSAAGSSGQAGGAGQSAWGGLTPDSTPAEQAIDLFGTPGHKLWAEVSEQQLALMNQVATGGGPIFDIKLGLPNGDLYAPGGSVESYADHLVVQDAATGSVADYGKVQAKLVGQSTMRPWSAASIPNLKVDMDEFQDKLRLGGEEHFRLNNGQVGSIFREQLAHRLYRALGYPALRTSFAFLGSNVWGPETWVPMVLTEVYKGKFCRDNAQALGGQCVNMWEFAGDLGSGEIPADSCKLKACDDTRGNTLGARIATAPIGAGFAASLADLIDWPRFHQFQCLSWMLWTGDDALHNSNNNLVIERDDGRLMWLPYSVDISMGQQWYQQVTLYGTSALALGCQQDPACWADTISTCEGLVADFDALDPEKLVDETQATLTTLGMMRDGDEQRADDLRAWLVQRQADLPAELVLYTEPAGPDGCPASLERCADNSCGTHQQCIELACPAPVVWCESTQQCYEPQVGVCPSCDVATPLYCNPTSSCVADVDACSAACSAEQRYCPQSGLCIQLFDWCPGDVGPGPMPLLAGGVAAPKPALVAPPYAL
jgi:hypothetical protein